MRAVINDYELPCLHRKDSGSRNITTEYVLPRGKTHAAGIDHKPLTLTYTWTQVI